MNQQDYNKFLQDIDQTIDDIKNDQDKDSKINEFREMVDNINNKASTDYIDFINQNPEAYNSRIEKLKEALSFNQPLADSLQTISASQSPASAPTIPAEERATYNDVFLPNIEEFAKWIEDKDEQGKADARSTIEQGIQRLNDEAKKYAPIIAEDPSKYDAAVYKLLAALGYDSTLANSVLTSETLAAATTQPSTAGTDSAAPAQPTTTSEPDQETLNAAFAKYMGSSFNPNSSMDKGKMETVKNALKKYQEETGEKFDINDSDALNKMRPIMNAAYQSEEYKKVAGVGTRTGAQPSAGPTTAPRQQTAAQRRATAPASPKGGPTYYVRTGFNRYVPAVEADIASGQQLFMQNPNRAARMVYPYVKVDSRPVRRATPAR